MSVARVPQLGSKPVVLSVKLRDAQVDEENLLCKGLQELYRRGEMTDVELVCAEQRFLAHGVVLASRSTCFRNGLQQAASSLSQGMRHEVRLSVPNPEAVKIMLDHMYMIDPNEFGKFNPRTQEVNRDVLSLAKQFELPSLSEQAMRWLSRDLNTGNVVERLALCEEFGLTELFEKIVEQLTFNKQALANIASSQQIMQHPKLMQLILQRTASTPALELEKTPTKTKPLGSSAEAQSTVKSKRARKS